MNKRGQFSIIAALLVAVILITTVVATYSAIRNNPVQNESPILSAIDETNLAIKQVLGFTVGYYGSILQVTGNSTYAKTLATNYLQSGMQNIVSTHPEWGTSLNLKDSSLQTYWFTNASYSNGNLTVSYDLAGLGITGVNYQTSCRLSVQIVSSPNGQACLNVIADENEPLVSLGKQNFNFYRYNNPNSTWEVAVPDKDPTAYANGTYSIDIPSGINPYSYVVQVQDQRGIIVVASSFNSYACGLTWNSTSVPTGSPTAQNYVNDTSDVDSSPDKGAHSSFPAQKNTDGVYDNLTEGNFPIISGDTQQFVESNSSDIDGNGNTGTAGNFTTEQYSDNIYDTLTEANPNVAYIPITITNTQSSATPSTLQQSITWNPSSYTSYEASDLGNIRFYSDSGLATPLYAWLENCNPSLSNTATSATAWVKLTNPIAANGGTKTIYMAFLSINQGFDGNYWGDAPNLSTTYGQYDNGANVFTQYGGASWSSFTTVEGTWDTSNGYLEQTATTGNYVGGPAALIEGTSYSVSSSYVLETAVSYTAEAIARVGIIADASLISGDAYGYRFIGQQGSNGAGFVSFLNDWRAWVVNNAYQGAISTPYTLQVVDNAGTWSSTLYSGYGISGATLTTLAATSYTDANEKGATTGYVGVSAAYYTGSNVVANPAQFQWFRMRQMPPSNVMPSASFGSIFLTSNYQLDLERQWTSAPYNANGPKLLCIKTGIMSTEALEVDVWTGSWTVLNTSLVANAWNNISVSSYLTAATFTIRFVTTNDTVQSTWQIDSVLLHTWNINYELNLEEQWTNVNYTSAQLCIKTGSLAAEALAVDAWNGSAWIKVLASLNANSWNNVTVSSYLQPSTFTIRFKSTDTVQDSWQIDAALLAVCPTADLYSLSKQGTIVVELLQNGTMRWNGQNLILTNSTSIPFPPVPVKSIHVNQTINGMNSEVPFQVEDWSSAYRIPLGLTSNASIFNGRTMLVFLVTPNASKTTIWWNGSDTASQTSLAYTNRYFNDSPSSGKISNGLTTLQFQSNFVVTSTVGTSSSTANFMRVNNYASSYGSHLAYVITNGTVRDIIHQEPEWSNGVPNCSDIYSDVVLTLPANTTYYTYQLRLMFVQSQQNRTISDLCPVWLTSLTGQLQTENGTANGLPIVSNATDLFYNYSISSWAHHWSQSISGTKGAGIMFTDSANQNLYIFDSISGTKTGALLSNSTAGTIQLLPVVKSQASFNTTSDPRMQDIIWHGAIVTFDTTTPIYSNSDQTGLWIIVEYPPTVTVTTENYQQP